MIAAPALLGGLILAASPAVGADDHGLRLSAERIELDGEVVSGEGAVRAVIEGGALTAARFELATDGSWALLEDGCWEREDGRVCFERLELEPGGSARIDGADLSLCACEGERQLWSVSAWRVRVDPERSAVFVGGLLRIGGCPVLPIPAGAFPLGERHSGLLAPRVGWTQDGLELGQPVYLTLGRAADLTLEPIWREERGLRMGNELRWALPNDGGGQLDLVAGWDAVEDLPRGLLAIEHGYVDRAFRSAVSGEIASDEAYLVDYESDFARRQQDFHELRALVGLGPARLEHQRFQSQSERPQRLLGLVVSRPAGDAGPLSPEAWLDLELGGDGDTARWTTDQWLRAWGGAGLHAGRPIGPVEAEAKLVGQGAVLVPADFGALPLDPAGATDSALLEGQLSAEGRAMLPLWADHGRVRHLLRAGLVVGGGLGHAQDGLDRWTRRLEDTPLWWAGPAVESRWLSATAVPVHVRAVLPWSDEGLAPTAVGWWSDGPWWGRVQGSARWQPGSEPSDGLAWVEAGRRSELFSAAVGVIALQDEASVGQLSARAAWQLPLGADRWEPRARVRWAMADARFVEQHLGLYFASRCDCLGLELGATWAEDRETPSFGMRVDLGR